MLEALWERLNGPAEGVAASDSRLGSWMSLTAMLDCHAYESAALMFLPEGWMVVSWSELGLAGGCTAQLGNPGTGGEVTSDEGARTLALALAAAIAKVGEA